jgi:hypothetical protein
MLIDTTNLTPTAKCPQFSILHPGMKFNTGNSPKSIEKGA